MSNEEPSENKPLRTVLKEHVPVSMHLVSEPTSPHPTVPAAVLSAGANSSPQQVLGGSQQSGVEESSEPRTAGSALESTQKFSMGGSSNAKEYAAGGFGAGEAASPVEATETEIMQPGRRARRNTKGQPLSRELPDFGGRYEVLELLGEGGMGTVYKVREVKSNKIFAIKVLKAELSQDAAAVRRFEQEVTAASELEHVNLVFVYGADRTSSGAPYMVMNFVDGVSLSTLIESGTIEYAQAVDIFTQVAEALVHAHSKNIVHRDLKPSNILVLDDINRKNAVRVVDFGIAKVGLIDLRKTSELTQTGELFGSPLYMSPEQCVGETLDVRSDIYSFGCVMYETLCGKPPFSDDNAIKTMMQHLHNAPPTMQAASTKLKMPKDLERVVLTCLNKQAGNRYQSARTLLDDLKSVQRGRAISQHATSLASVELGARNALNKRWLLQLLASFLAGCLVTYLAMRLVEVPSATAPIPDGNGHALENL